MVMVTAVMGTASHSPELGNLSAMSGQKKPRILVINSLYPPLSLGGYSQACQRAVDGLRARGYDVLVLTSDYGLERSSRQQHIWRELWYNLASPYQNLGRLGRLRFELHNQGVLKRALHEWQPDVVFVWSMWGLGMALLLTIQRLGIPILYYVHDNWLADGYDNDPWLWHWRYVPASAVKRLGKRLLYQLLVRPLLARVIPVKSEGLDLDHIAFISQFRKQECLTKGWPVAHARVIYNGIDPARFHPESDSPKDLGLQILFAGRLVPAKGPHIVLEALAELVTHSVAPAALTLAGSGGAADPQHDAYLRQLEAQANRPLLKGRVRFLGAVDPDRMPEVYREHNVFVFASSEREGFPLVLLEAMASGLAVVSTTVGGAAEILAPGHNCLTFSPGDAQGLAECLRQLLADPALRDRIAAAGLDTVRKHFAFSHMLDALEELINETVEQRTFSRPPDHPGLVENHRHVAPTAETCTVMQEEKSSQ